MADASVFWHLNSVLVGVVCANAQGATEPLLATHADDIWSYLLATIVYCFALEADDAIRSRAQQNQEDYTHFWRIIAFIFGSLSSVSLVSTMVPRSAGSVILCITWICAVIIIVLYQYGRLFVYGCRRLYHEILNNQFFNNIWNWIRGSMSTETTEQPRPTL